MGITNRKRGVKVPKQSVHVRVTKIQENSIVSAAIVDKKPKAGKRENDHNVVKTRGSSLKNVRYVKKYVNIQTVVLNKQYNRSNNVKSVINPSFTKAASVPHACLKRTDASYGSA